MLKIQCPHCRSRLFDADITIGVVITKCKCGQYVKIVDKNFVIAIDKPYSA